MTALKKTMAVTLLALSNFVVACSDCPDVVCFDGVYVSYKIPQDLERDNSEFKMRWATEDASGEIKEYFEDKQKGSIEFSIELHSTDIGTDNKTIDLTIFYGETSLFSSQNNQLRWETRKCAECGRFADDKTYTRAQFELP